MDLYEAVASRAEEHGQQVTGAQVEAAIGATSAGSPSDSFWGAFDNEVSRLADFFLSVAHEPVIKERISNVERTV